MALVIEVANGKSFWVGDVEVVVTRITSHTSFDLKVNSEWPKIYRVSDSRSIEILPNVRVSAGLGGKPKVDSARAGLARIAIEAPRSIKILRDDIKNKATERHET